MQKGLVFDSQNNVPNESYSSYDVVDKSDTLVEQNASFNETEILNQSINQQEETIHLQDAVYVNTGDYLMIADELCYVPTSQYGKEMDIWRGILDTVPSSHNAGEVVCMGYLSIPLRENR